MRLRDIALQNLRRRRGRAAFVVAGLMIGVATVVGLVTLFRSVSHDIAHKMERYGANILVAPRSESLALHYGGLALGGVSLETRPLGELDVARIRSIPTAGNLVAVGPMVLGTVNVGGRDVALAGVDFAVARVLKPWWGLEERLPAAGEVVAGHAAAERLGLAPGALVEVARERLAVARVLEPAGSQDDELLFADLRVAQRLLGKEGEVSLVEIAAHCMDCPIEEMIAELSAALPGARVMAIRQVVEGRMDAMGHFERFLYGVSLLVVLVGCLVVFVTMTGSVRERTTEIGVFLAIGLRRGHVMRVVLLEAAAISALAGVLGYAAGIGASRLALPLFTGGGEAALRLDPLLAAGAVLAAVALGLLASVHPALVASRMDPTEALRAL